MNQAIPPPFGNITLAHSSEIKVHIQIYTQETFLLPIGFLLNKSLQVLLLVFNTFNRFFYTFFRAQKF